jgi:putative ABC transport system permease protein
MQVLISTLSQGLIWTILTLGVFITFRILNFADMTAEGSLTFGGSLCAALMLRGVNPFLSLIIAGLVGSLAGLITGILHTKFKIQAILSGILTMIALYSVNIRIMGKANLSLLGKSTIFSALNNIFPMFKSDFVLKTFIIGFVICIFSVVSLNLFFKTQLGLAVRATGDNEQMMRALGGNTDFKKILALMISSFFCGLAGALIAQSQGYSDVNMGTGSIVIALASIVIGEAFLSFIKLKNKILNSLICMVLGSIVYRIIIFIVLNLGMNPSDLKLFTACITAVLLGLPKLKKFKLKLGGNKNA